jgi:hypothetical protein
MEEKLQGNDVNIEISLKEYGIAWIERKDEFMFYFGISVDDNCRHDRFGWGTIEKDIDIRKEYSWVDFDRVNEFVGMGFFELSLPQQISDLVSYYGTVEIFGESYTEGSTYDEVVKDKITS